jgi:hypothetical protein
MPYVPGSYFKKKGKNKGKKGKKGKKKATKNIAKKSDFLETGVYTKFVKSIQQLFPDRLRCKLRNFYNQTFACAGGAIYSAGIMANNLHVPISAPTTAGATLPFASSTSIVGLGAILGASGPAQAAPYWQYRIHGSYIKCMIQSSVNGTSPGIFVLFPTTDYASLPAVNTFNVTIQQEYPYSRIAHVGGYTLNRGVIVSNSMTTARIFGLKYKSSIEDPSYAGQSGTAVSANNTWAWVYSFFPDTGNNSAITIDIEVIYDIEFFDRNLMTTGAA